MADDNFEVEIYTLTDEDGNESEFELIGRMDADGQTYVALIPVEDGEGESDEYEFVVLKVVVEDGEETFVTIDDDEEFERIADAFEDELMLEVDYDGDEDSDDDSEDK